jgi:basic membrane protein A
MNRRRFILLLAVMLVFSVVLFGCGDGGGSESTDSPDAGNTDANANKGLKIAIITSSGVDDGSFGQNCYEGILAFVDKHPDCEVTDIKEPDIDKMIAAVESVVGDYDVLVLPGFQFAAVGPIAEVNPDKKFLLIDTPPTNAEGEIIELSNVYSMTFAEEESGFFAGLAAALETKTNKVAVVNGIAFPSNVNYQYGFMSGVHYANKHFGSNAEIVELPSYSGKDVAGNEVGGNYVGAFADEATGKVIGSTLIDNGVDIMFVAAGASGNGVFTAAKEAEKLVIGCDVDQYDDGAYGDGKNIILTSALKVMDINITRQLEAIYNGSFKGENALLKADTDSTGFVSTPGRHQMSDATVAKLNEAKELLKTGKIIPASSNNGYRYDEFPGL